MSLFTAPATESAEQGFFNGNSYIYEEIMIVFILCCSKCLDLVCWFINLHTSTLRQSSIIPIWWQRKTLKITKVKNLRQNHTGGMNQMEFQWGCAGQCPCPGSRSFFFLGVKADSILCLLSPPQLEFSFYSWEKLPKPPNNLNLCLVILHLLNECKLLYFLSFVGLWTSASYFIGGLTFFFKMSNLP